MSVQPSWSHTQTRRSYPDFVGMFDSLRDDEVRWTPYSLHDVTRRAPYGVSTLCWRDMAYWKTRRALVFDIYVEEHAVHRVMCQFGLYQESGLLAQTIVAPATHRYAHDYLIH